VLDTEVMDSEETSNLDIERKRSVVETLENELEMQTREYAQLLEKCTTEDDCKRMDTHEVLMQAKKAQVEHAKEELRTAEQEAERREEAARIKAQMREKAAEEARQKAIAAAAAAAAAPVRHLLRSALKRKRN
jgi:CO dehydrogenase/acetyl-CoA synthase beta subunit